jgi:hypothetical protein
MTQDKILKLIERHGLTLHGDIEHFAALIEKHLYYDGVHTCHDECQRPACVAVRKAVEREREACALAVEQAGIDGYGTLAAAAMIRARGER